jgi:hypothetical protein
MLLGSAMKIKSKCVKNMIKNGLDGQNNQQCKENDKYTIYVIK